MLPAELRPAIEKQTDLVRRHLVDAVLLPDVAHLAAEVAVIGRDERHLVGERRGPQIGAHNRAGEAQLSREHQPAARVTAGPDRRRLPIRWARSCNDLSSRDSWRCCSMFCSSRNTRHGRTAYWVP